jgi:hypothetical protein
MTKRVVFVDGDDWQGLYVDGKLKIEAHTISACDVLEELGLDFDIAYPNEEWLFEAGSLPENINGLIED